MNTERITTSYPAPFYSPRPGDDAGITREEMAAASREASQREMELTRSRNAPRPLQQPQLTLKAPVISEDFVQQVATLDQKIYERGLAVSRERLMSLGHEVFQRLLAADHEARLEQREIEAGVDLTSWTSVYRALASMNAFASVPVPRRSTHDEWAGVNEDFDEVRKVEGFRDLWKLNDFAARAIRAISNFRDCFESLLFGQSLLERVSDDGRVRSKFFCGGRGDKVNYFRDWLSVLQGAHTVTLKTPVASVVLWLAGEQSPPPDVLELAKDWFGVRLPNETQIAIAQAVLDGFLLNHSGWHFWQFVGRSIRRLPDKYAVGVWRDKLAGRFPKVVKLHSEIESSFLKAVGNHWELDRSAHRQFLDQTVADLRNTVSGVMALAVNSQLTPVVARVGDYVLLEPKVKKALGKIVKDKLEVAFPGSVFSVEISERLES